MDVLNRERVIQLTAEMGNRLAERQARRQIGVKIKFPAWAREEMKVLGIPPSQYVQKIVDAWFAGHEQNKRGRK